MQAAAPQAVVDFGPGPNRFRDPLRPEHRTGRKGRLLGALQNDERLIEHFRRAHFRGDVAADDLVDWVHGVGVRKGMAVVERGIEHGRGSIEDAPAIVRAFFEEVDVVPGWLSRGSLVRACRVPQRASLGHGYVLFSISLLAGYVSAGITKTLVATGELERMAPRRVAETSKFVDDLYSSGPLERSSEGFRSTLRVRLMHAFVRRKLLKSGWDVERWGIPINQADMAATVLSFSVSYLLGLRALGFLIPRRDREDFVHLWRYVGTLMGVEAGLLPATESEALRLLKLVAVTQDGPDDDGRALAQALLRVPIAYGGTTTAGRLLGRFDASFCAGFTRFAIGKRSADGLGLPDTGWKYAFLGFAAANFCTELVGTMVPPVANAKARAGRALDRRRMAPLLVGRPVEFAPRPVSTTG